MLGQKRRRSAWLASLLIGLSSAVTFQPSALSHSGLANTQCVELLQPVGIRTVEELYDSAHRSRDAFSRLMGELQRDLPSQVQGKVGLIRGPEKEASRVDQKLRDKSGDPRRIKDLLRASIVVESIADVYRVGDYLKKHYSKENRAVRDRFQNPKSTGYRDLKVLIRLKESGHVVEFQVHLAPLKQVKTERADTLYASIRELKLRQNEGRELSKLEQDRLQYLKRRHRELFDEAFREHLEKEIGEMRALSERRPLTETEKNLYRQLIEIYAKHFNREEFLFDRERELLDAA